MGDSGPSPPSCVQLTKVEPVAFSLLDMLIRGLIRLYPVKDSVLLGLMVSVVGNGVKLLFGLFFKIWFLCVALTSLEFHL